MTPESPVFESPWQAQAFALVVQLAERGVFSWPEWVQAFAAEESCSDAPYYERWLAAAEKLLVAKGVTSADQLAARAFAIGATGPLHTLK